MGCRPEMPLVCAISHDFLDLRNGKPQLVVGVVVVGAEPQAGVGSEVAEDLALGELLVDGLESGRARGDRAAAAGGVARAADLEAGVVEELDQELRLADRVLADALDTDLLD